MRICEGRQVLVLLGKVRNGGDSAEQQPTDNAERTLHKYYIGIVSDVAGGRAEMDYSLRAGACVAVRLDMRHNIVTHLMLVLTRTLVIYIVDMRTQLRNLLLGYAEPELALALRKGYPELSPCTELRIGGEYLLHLGSRIACAQRIFVNIAHSVGFLSCIRQPR